jgi:hypothetical protein
VIVVWALAGTEIVSALARRRRDGAMTAPTFTAAKRRLLRLEAAWNEVHDLDAHCWPSKSGRKGSAS